MPNAIHPDYFKDFRGIAEIKQPTTADEVEKEEAMYAALATQPVWSYLKKYIVDLIDVLDTPAQTAMETGCSYDEIGRKTIVAQLTKEFLLKVVDKVENARIARESQV